MDKRSHIPKMALFSETYYFLVHPNGHQTSECLFNRLVRLHSMVTEFRWASQNEQILEHRCEDFLGSSPSNSQLFFGIPLSRPPSRVSPDKSLLKSKKLLLKLLFSSWSSAQNSLTGQNIECKCAKYKKTTLLSVLADKYSIKFSGINPITPDNSW